MEVKFKTLFLFFVLYLSHKGFAQEDREIDIILTRLTSIENRQKVLENNQVQCSETVKELQNIISIQKQRIEDLEKQQMTKTGQRSESVVKETTKLTNTKAKGEKNISKTDFNSEHDNNHHSGFYRKRDNRQSENEGHTQNVDTKKRLLIGDGNLNNFIGFSAKLSSNLNHLTTDHIIPFKTIKFNEGNGYNGSDGIFIAPRSGVYFFAWNMMVQSGWGAYVKFMVNGDIRMYTAVNTDNGYADGSNFILARLNAGDHVWLAIYHGESNLYAQSSFTGFLVSQ